jgi:hypothetical protein
MRNPVSQNGDFGFFGRLNDLSSHLADSLSIWRDSVGRGQIERSGQQRPSFTEPH